MTEVEAAYIAGLFDGEGTITYKKYPERKKKGNKVNTYNCWRISMEIAMTDESVLNWLHEALKVGTVTPKKVKLLGKLSIFEMNDLRIKSFFKDFNSFSQLGNSCKKGDSSIISISFSLLSFCISSGKNIIS